MTEDILTLLEAIRKIEPELAAKFEEELAEAQTPEEEEAIATKITETLAAVEAEETEAETEAETEETEAETEETEAEAEENEAETEETEAEAEENEAETEENEAEAEENEAETEETEAEAEENEAEAEETGTEMMIANTLDELNTKITFIEEMLKKWEPVINQLAHDYYVPFITDPSAQHIEENNMDFKEATRIMLKEAMRGVQ